MDPELKLNSRSWSRLVEGPQRWTNGPLFVFNISLIKTTLSSVQSVRELEVFSKRFALLRRGNIPEGRKRWSNYRKVAKCINTEQSNSLAAALKATFREPCFAQKINLSHSVSCFVLFLPPVMFSREPLASRRRQRLRVALYLSQIMFALLPPRFKRTTKRGLLTLPSGCSRRKTLSVTRTLWVTWIPASRLWGRGMCGRFLY